MIWIYLSTTCHKYKDICITSSQTTHKNPGHARFSKFSSSENRVSHDLNNRNWKKKQSATLDFLRSTLKPFKEPSGTMWHDVVFRFPVSRFLELESAGGVQPAYTPHSDTQFLANQNPGKTDMESYKVLVWRNLEKPIIFSDLLVWCFSISVTQCLTWMTKLWLLKYPWNSTWSRFVWWINVYFWKKGPRHGNDLNKKWSFM